MTTHGPSLRAKRSNLARTSFEAALGFGLIDTQGIQLVELVQEARLRGDRHQRAVVDQQHRLPQLPIPRSEAERRALVSSQLETAASHICADRLRIGFAGAGRRLA